MIYSYAKRRKAKGKQNFIAKFVMGSPFAIYRMCNGEPKSFQDGVIYGTLCKGRCIGWWFAH